jgi:hypothetical protein
MRDLAFAVIGAGFWGELQIAAWGKVAGARLVGVCDHNSARAAAVAARCGDHRRRQLENHVAAAPGAGIRAASASLARFGQEDRRPLASWSPPKTVSVTVGTGPTVPLPTIGLAVASHGDPLSVREVELLRALHVAHLRVDLRLWEQEWRAALQRGAREASQLGCPLEVGVFLTDSGPAELPPLLHALQAEQARVCRYIIFHRSEKAVASRWILLARNWLQAHDRSSRLGGGKDANFFELTSFRPPGHGLDVICFSMQPQAHAFDNDSLVETLEMQ